MSTQTNTHNLTIEPICTDHFLPLYTEWAGQESSAYIALDTRDGEVWLKERAPHESGITFDEAYGNVRTYRIPNNLTVDGLSRLLADETVLRLLERVYQGSTEEWNGSNYVSTLGADAEEADEALEHYCGEIDPLHYGSLEPWDAADYFGAVGLSDLLREGEELETAAVRLQKEAMGDGVFVSARGIEIVLEEKQRKTTDDE